MNSYRTTNQPDREERRTFFGKLIGAADYLKRWSARQGRIGILGEQAQA